MIQIKQGTRSAQATSALTVGSGPESDFFVGDPIMAARHLEIRDLGGGRFECRDLGTVTGTYVSGEAIREHLLADGDEVVVGTTGIRVKIKGEGEKAQLQLTVRLNSFAYQKSKEGAFDNDPDRWVQSEQGLSRFPALSFGNRLALVAGAVGLVAVGVVSSWFETVSDPGPLTAPHGVLFGQIEAGELAGNDRILAAQALVEDQSCAVCHVGGGTPQSACMVCHDDLQAPKTRRHPFLGDDFEVLATMADNGIGHGDPEGFCVVCHTDHEPERQEDGKVLLKAGAEALTGDCAGCHGALAALPQPPLPEVATPLAEVSSIRFPHGKHVDKGIDCAICHVVDEDRRRYAALGLDDPAASDFGEVPYETCAECHVKGTQPRAEIATRAAEWVAQDWQVDWHGSEQGADTCGRCHAANEAGGIGPEFLTVARARGGSEGEAAGGTRAQYEVERRRHMAQFEDHAEGRACIECHRDRRGNAGGATPESTTARAAFWHGLHLASADVLTAVNTTSRGRDASAACLTCHGSLAGSRELVAAPDGWWRAEGEDAEGCATCHFEMDGDERRPTALRPVASDVPVDGPASVPQFPHEFHTDLEGGCYACHSFEPAAGGGGDAFALLARTDFEAASCANCHGGHEQIAGNACQQCHAFDAGRRDVYWIAAQLDADPRAGRPPLTVLERPWPEPNGFSHLSSGHVGHACEDCHGDASVRGELKDLKAPNEGDQLCRDCHLEKQFHWR